MEWYGVMGLKCFVCKTNMGQIKCVRFNGEICSKCCDSHKNVRDCEHDCSYMQQHYERLHTNTIELTELGRGKVTQFSDSLFIPDLFECFICNLYDTEIQILEPTRIRLSTEFIIEKIVDKDVKLSDSYNIDKWKKGEDCPSGIPFLQLYSIGIGKVEHMSLMMENTKINVGIENNHVDTWLPSSYSKVEPVNMISQELHDEDMDDGGILTYYGRHFIGNNSTMFAEIISNQKYKISFDAVYTSPFFEESMKLFL